MQKNQKEMDADLMERAYAMIAVTRAHWPIMSAKKKKVRPSSVQYAPMMIKPISNRKEIMELFDAMLPRQVRSSLQLNR